MKTSLGVWFFLKTVDWGVLDNTHQYFLRGRGVRVWLHAISVQAWHVRMNTSVSNAISSYFVQPFGLKMKLLLGELFNYDQIL